MVGRDERTWVFENEYSDMVQIVDFSEFFVRSNLIAENPNMGLLFELSIYCQKKVSSQNII